MIAEFLLDAGRVGTVRVTARSIESTPSTTGEQLLREIEPALLILSRSLKAKGVSAIVISLELPLP